MDVGFRIKYFRKKKGISTYELSQTTGISQPVISKLENGNRSPDVNLLEKIAKSIGIPLEVLLKSSKTFGEWLHSEIPETSGLDNALDVMGISLEQYESSLKNTDIPSPWHVKGICDAFGLSYFDAIRSFGYNYSRSGENLAKRLFALIEEGAAAPSFDKNNEALIPFLAGEFDDKNTDSGEYESLKWFARIFNVTVEYLLGYTETRNESLYSSEQWNTSINQSGKTPYRTLMDQSPEGAQVEEGLKDVEDMIKIDPELFVTMCRAKDLPEEDRKMLRDMSAKLLEMHHNRKRETGGDDKRR